MDRYLRMACGQAEAVVNETCSWLRLNAQGLLGPHAAPAIGAEVAPAKNKWAQVRSLVLGEKSAAIARQVKSTQTPTLGTQRAQSMTWRWVATKAPFICSARKRTLSPTLI